MLLNIQVLRAIAAFLVVFVHVEPLATLAGLGSNSTAFGNSGVDLFFVISGLIMVVTTSERRQTAAYFLRHRIARVVPLYWFVTFSVFALALVAPTLFQSTRASVGDLLKSLAFIPYQRLDGQMHPLVFVGWTLNYEMFFYAIFAVGLLFPVRLIGYAFSLIVLAFAAAAGQILRPHDPLLAFYTQPLLLEFGGGMVLGILFTKNLIPARFAYAGLFLGLIAFAAMLLGPRLFPHIDRSVEAGIPALIIVGCALAAERAGLVWKNVGVQLLGAASYSIYLTHFFSTDILIKAAGRFSHPSELTIGAIFAAALVLVAVVGIAIHRTIELPLTAEARWLLGGRHKPLPHAVTVSEPEIEIQETETVLLPTIPGGVAHLSFSAHCKIQCGLLPVRQSESRR